MIVAGVQRNKQFMNRMKRGGQCIIGLHIVGTYVKSTATGPKNSMLVQPRDAEGSN